jgi:hypothetical protein
MATAAQTTGLQGRLELWARWGRRAIAQLGRSRTIALALALVVGLVSAGCDPPALPRPAPTCPGWCSAY